MQTAINTRAESPAVIYRISCENPGCGHSFDLQITAKDVGLLGGTMACPRCRRHGGTLKPIGKLGNKLFGAKLIFKLTGVTTSTPNEEGDLLTDIS